MACLCRSCARGCRRWHLPTWLGVVVLCRCSGAASKGAQQRNSSFVNLLAAITDETESFRNASGLGSLLDAIVASSSTSPHMESTSLYGNTNEYAYYYVDLLVGSPDPQRVSVIADTGSTLCAFPCHGCNHCGKHLDPLFDVSRSQTAKWLSCNEHICSNGCIRGYCAYRQHYTEGSSIDGFWFEDMVQLGDADENNSGVFTHMGCHINEKKLFFTQRANGILGLAPGDASRPSFFQSLFQDKEHVESGIFSMCLAEWGGQLTVGGYNTSYHESVLKWMPMSAEVAHYSVVLTSLVMDNGEVIEGGGLASFGPAVVDSGSTHTYFPSYIFDKLQAALRSRCNLPQKSPCNALPSGKNCYKLPSTNSVDDLLHSFPVFTLHFDGGVEVHWKAHSYLYQVDTLSGEHLWCISFADNGRVQQTVLGISWMKHLDVVFDIRSGQLGVAEANCPEYRRRPVAPMLTQQIAVEEEQPATGIIGLVVGTFGNIGFVWILLLATLCYVSLRSMWRRHSLHHNGTEPDINAHVDLATMGEALDGGSATASSEIALCSFTAAASANRCDVSAPSMCGAGSQSEAREMRRLVAPRGAGAASGAAAAAAALGWGGAVVAADQDLATRMLQPLT